MKGVHPNSLSLRGRLGFLIKDSFLYGGATALSRAIALVTFPLLTRYFTVEEYGQIDLFISFTNFLAVSIVFGQDSSVARFFYEYVELEDRRELISQSFVFQIIILILVLPFLWMWADHLALLLSSSSEATGIFKLNILQIPFLVFNNFSVNLLKWTFSRNKFLFISLGSVFLYMILIVLGTKYRHLEILDVFICALIVQIIFSLCGLWFVRAWIVVPRNWNFLRELFTYALPYGIICCLGGFVPTMERSLVSMLVGPRELGLYAAGTKVAMLMSVVVQAFQTAWGPFSLSMHKESDSSNTFNLALKGFVILVGLMVILLTSLADPILGFLASEAYRGASIVVFPLALGIAFQSIGWITDIGIGLSKRSYLKLISYVVFVIITGSSIYLLARPFGLLGIASGVMLGHVVNAFTSTYLAQRAYPLRWSFRELISPLTLIIVMGVTMHSLNGLMDLWTRLSLLFCFIVIFILSSYLIMFESEERRRMRLFFSKYKEE